MNRMIPVRGGRILALWATGLIGHAPAPPANASADLASVMPLHSGAVTITAPTSFSLGKARPGQTMVSRLKPVRVDDTRGPGAADWTATVSATEFSPGSGRAITKAHISYWSGPAIRTTGDGVFTPGQLSRGRAQSLSTTRVAFSHFEGSSENSASWRPFLVISIPDTAAADEYAGSIIHSVA
ncbi:hypothetical protein AB0L00_26545 [Actinoallomurus sp. NPDC052308]|uniref:hypothetical protein n=1 Tax=Actinoallomurus sp. NPDC052308 TaxID=3155530 RepID=UPI00343E9EF5